MFHRVPKTCMAGELLLFGNGTEAEERPIPNRAHTGNATGSKSQPR